MADHFENGLFESNRALGDLRLGVEDGEDLLDQIAAPLLFERRIAKLSQSLDTTEKELKRVAAMKNVETGVASIYRTVQGLSDDDDNAEQKREMMQDIFDANMAFRKELKAKKK